MTNGQFISEEGNMVSKLEKNKLLKENKLYNAAYDLFTSHGINETSISDIAKHAGVGKGTFYLYFKDKYDILDRIIFKKSSDVLVYAVNETHLNVFEHFEDEVIFFINVILDFLEQDRLLLKLIHKNLSWGVLKKAKEDYEEINLIYHMFTKGLKDLGISEAEIDHTIYIVIELTGSVAYNTIILEEPSSLETMKPFLFDTIKRIIRR